MKTRYAFATLTMLTLLFALSASAFAKETYAVDLQHSAVIFKVKHLGASFTYGRFRKVSGTIVVDGDRSSVNIQVDPNSIYTADRDRDKHLRSPDFLNTKQFPTLSFKSKTVRHRGNIYVVKGDLTLHGKTRGVTMRMKHIGSAKTPQGTPMVGFEGSFSVKRSDYGMSKMIPMVGDEITLTIAVEATRK
ncbi:MAG: YceI family protein [Deltaproteobacteria bacterium]|nr:YceI family protein [Deltaproteobacteria bacterium]